MSLRGIVGNAAVIEGLIAELLRRPAHAYLFAGPAGVGKALVAQALAHVLLCERSANADFCCAPENCPVRRAAVISARQRTAAPAPERCSCCAACVQVASGVHPDFVYIARSRNRTEVLIEQVRELIQRLGLRPSRGGWRVAIIDEAETLNLPAQNALLKTVEEPPARTVIFLISQSERALLDTLRSRMRPVRFTRLEPPAIAQVLAARTGAATATTGVLARLARGSLGRALALSQGAEPPLVPLLQALHSVRQTDFATAQALAQQFFAAREQAADNFELIARLLEEMLCYRLLQAEFNAPSPEAARMMAEFAQAPDVATLAELLRQALEARAAIDAMANPRLQAENWWMSAGAALRGA